RKRLDEYQKLIKMGQQAMAAQKFDEAAGVFADAARLVPEDRTAATLLQQAEKAREEAKKTADVTAQKKEEEDRQRMVQKLLTSGRAAVAARKFEEAAKVLAEADRLAPNNPAMDQALKELEQAKKDAAADAEKARKLAEYQNALKAGRTALQA